MSFSQTFPRFSGSSSRRWLQRQFSDPYVSQKYSGPVKFRSRSAFKLLELERSHHFLLHKDVRCIVELGAAPGGWSQVLADKLGWLDPESVGSKTTPDNPSGLRRPYPLKDKRSDSSTQSTEPESDVLSTAYGTSTSLKNNQRKTGLATIIAVDKLRMDPIPGVNVLQMDFLLPGADAAISSLVETTETDSGGKVDVVLSDMAPNVTGNRISDSTASHDIANAVLEFSRRHLRTAREIGRQRGGVLM